MRKLSEWAVLAVIIALTGCTSQSTPALSARPSPALSSIVSSGPLVGVYEPDAPFAWGQQAAFGSATGASVRIAVYYSGWFERFRASFAQMARRRGSYVLVQMEPSNVSLASIASGQSDSYLCSYALSVRAFGYPVILSFGNEMNGNWYSWGSGHMPPSVFVAAWRHVVQVFRDEGASNAVWAWAVNSMNLAHSSLRQWWPGASWVNLVGIDGYYYHSSDTFSSVFGRTIAEIRKFSNAPVLISETAVGTVADRAGKIRTLIANVRADHLVGVVWFDKGQNRDVFHQDWRIEDNPAALAAFRAAVREYLRSSP